MLPPSFCLLQGHLIRQYGHLNTLLALPRRYVTTTTPSLASLKHNRKDLYRRRCVASHYRERMPLQAMVRNRILPEVVQRKARADIASQPRDACATRIRNRCTTTGRGRGVITEYKLCRMKFRELADFGLISGLTRSSW